MNVDPSCRLLSHYQCTAPQLSVGEWDMEQCCPHSSTAYKVYLAVNINYCSLKSLEFHRCFFIVMTVGPWTTGIRDADHPHSWVYNLSHPSMYKDSQQPVNPWTTRVWTVGSIEKNRFYVNLGSSKPGCWRFKSNDLDNTKIYNNMFIRVAIQLFSMATVNSFISFSHLPK